MTLFIPSAVSSIDGEEVVYLVRSSIVEQSFAVSLSGTVTKCLRNNYCDAYAYNVATLGTKELF